MDKVDFLKPFDLEQTWRKLLTMFEDRREAIKDFTHDAGQLQACLRSIVVNAILQLRQCGDFSHTSSIAGMKPPTPFDERMKTWDPNIDPEDLKTYWRSESIYAAVGQIERSSFQLSDAYTDLKAQLRKRGRRREPDWSGAENHAAVLSDVQSQSHNIQQIIRQDIEPFLQTISGHIQELKQDQSRLDSKLRTDFEAADEEGRFRLIAPLWLEVTDFKSASVWEATWHISRLKTLRTLLGMHLTETVAQECKAFEESLDQLRSKVGIRSKH